jgi:murein DD-endopeptidase MepM/ murein hydrolase activator NlpD
VPRSSRSVAPRARYPRRAEACFWRRRRGRLRFPPSVPDVPAPTRQATRGGTVPSGRTAPIRAILAPIAVLAFTALAAVVNAGPAAAEPPAPAPATMAPGRYLVPVEGEVIDPFRAPEHPYGPGNRGIDYRTAPLSAARAAAAGEVLFAGPVAGTLHVTLRHADGLRTTYSFLASIDVRVGQRVDAGAVVGRTLEVFHFGVRDAADNYLDPALFFGSPRGARLVPGGDDGALAPGSAEERTLLGVIDARAQPLELALARLGSPTATARPSLVGRTALWAHLLVEATAPVHDARVARALLDRARHPPPCTPPDQPPAHPMGRRILVEVAGIGSTSEVAAVERVDHAALGYAAPDVVRFSYAGGRVPAHGAGGRPGAGPLARLPESAYDAVDSQRDLAESAARLTDLLRAVSAAEPGVPIDVVAHSQGGVVARLALQRAARAGDVPAGVQTLVTLGAPHQGAEVAAAVAAGRLSARGDAVEQRLQAVLGLDLDGALPAGGQLSPVSPVVAELAGGHLPPGIRFTSVGARGDLVVTADRTAVPEGFATVVPVSGVRAHDRLPGTAAATREIALAVAGAPPTCRALTDVATDLVVAEGIARLEARAGLVVAGATSVGPLR